MVFSQTSPDSDGRCGLCLQSDFLAAKVGHNADLPAKSHVPQPGRFVGRAGSTKKSIPRTLHTMLIGHRDCFPSTAGIGAHGQVSTSGDTLETGARPDEHFARRTNLHFLRRSPDRPSKWKRRRSSYQLPDDRGGWEGQISIASKRSKLSRAEAFTPQDSQGSLLYGRETLLPIDVFQRGTGRS